MDVAIISVLMIFGIPILAILGWIFISTLKILTGYGDGRGGKMNAEETRIMQDIHQGLSRMEKRVESLETILLDRTRSAERHEESGRI